MIALTDGQELMFAVVGFVAVVVLMLLPTSRARPRGPSGSHRQLMKEIERHADPQGR